MNPISMTIMLVVGVAAFCWSMWRRLKLLRSLKPAREPRLNASAKRIAGVFEFAFGQLRLLKRDLYPGLMHAFIFWGFIVVGLRSIELFGQAYAADFQLPFLTGMAREIYYYTLMVFEILVTIAVVILLQRRLIVRPKRLTLSIEADIILIAIAVLMITDFIMAESDNRLSYTISYWIHTAGIVAFLNWLPYSKHFHIITAIPNVYLRRLGPDGALPLMNLEDEGATSFGTETIDDITWKQGLDLMTCTECGRCQDACPAYAAEMPLSPKELALGMRDAMYAQASKGDAPPLVPETVKPETLWSCTTCRACEEACPLFIEYVDRIIDMRRNLVLMRGEVPGELATALKNLETQGNPWGLGRHARGDWARVLNVPLIADKPDAEYLLFVGCAGSYDDRAKKISAVLVKILKAAGVSFAISGPEETCTGDFARRAGNEYLFQELAKANIATFERYGIKKILTQCPHCYNTLKNEYPQLGGRYEVTHHTELISQLLSEGRLPTPGKGGLSSNITYHDSCYLGRYNNIYDQPRAVLKSLGYEVIEPESHRDDGRCCGAGGGLMWLENLNGKRMNHIRAQELTDSTGANTIATSCPFCLTMLEDAYKNLGNADVHVKDIAEIVAELIIH